MFLIIKSMTGRFVNKGNPVSDLPMGKMTLIRKINDRYKLLLRIVSR